ncbi:MAG: glycosyltransferase [Thermoanaerobaculia bacterium]
MTPSPPGVDVLFVCEYFAPAELAGGGARSLVNTVARLGARFRFAVVTRDHDVGDPRPFGNPPSRAWVRVGLADVYYAPDRELTLRRLLALVRAADPAVVYLNSLFSVLAIRILLLRRLGWMNGRSVVVAPEGELGAGALVTRSLRKHLYLRLARASGLLRGVLWKAASAPEAELVRQWFGEREPVTIAASLSPSPSPAGSEPAEGARTASVGGRSGELELLFVSRIDPKKNLHFLLVALRQVRVPIHFGLAGPIADPVYWRRCERALALLPVNVRVTLYGALPPKDVPELLSRFDVLALPTLDENYGYVVLEALAAGCFVLLSPHTPWSDIEPAGVGQILEVADPAPWCAAIEALAVRSQAERERSRYLAVEYARRHLTSDEPLRLLEELLAEAVSLTAARTRR